MASGGSSHESMIFNLPTILKLLSKEIYNTELASLRENLQNAVDAIRVRGKDGLPFTPRIDLKLDANKFSVADNGNGMNKTDLRNLYWAVGKSGKEDMQDICIGTFGVGAIANFGIAKELRVTSRKSQSDSWWNSRLGMKDILDTPDGQTPKIEFTVKENVSLNDIGTIVDVIFTKPLSEKKLEEAQKYIETHVSRSDIPVHLNGRLISQSKWLAPEDAFLPKEKGQTTWYLFDKEINVNYHVYENQKAELSIQFESDEIKGISLPKKGPSTILKRGFKLCDHSPDYQYFEIHLIVDCWLFSPTAGRDTLSEDSGEEFNTLIGNVETLIMSVASKSNDRMRAVSGLFNRLLYTSDLSHFDNLVVQLIMGDSVALKDIRKNSDESTKKVFFTPKDSRAAQSLAARGHAVVLLPSNHYEQQCVQKYLEKKYDARDLKQFEALDQTIPEDELTEDERAAISMLQHDIADHLNSPDVKVVPALLKENLTFYWPPESENKAGIIYCNVKHKRIVNALSQKGGWRAQILFSYMMDDIGEQVYRYRRQTMEKDDLDVDSIMQNRFRRYELSLADVQRISSRRQIVISFSDIQTLNTAKGNNEEDEKPTKKIVYIESPIKWGGQGCYLQLDPFGHNDMQRIKDYCDKIEVWWSGNVVNYYFQYSQNKFFMVSIEVDNLILINDGLNGPVSEHRLPIVMEEYTYIPLPPILEPHIVPTDSEKITTVFVKSRLFQDVNIS